MRPIIPPASPHHPAPHPPVLHTSASLTINENASPDVPLDMEDALNRIAPEGNHYRHLDEGYDDMPGALLPLPFLSTKMHRRETIIATWTWAMTTCQGTHYHRCRLGEGNDDMTCQVRSSSSPTPFATPLHLIALNRIAPEGNHYCHLDEGYDDMPAHVKSSLMGCSLTVPIMSGRFKLGTWQGIYLNEHRNYGGARQLCITIQGEKRTDGRVYR
ncbi:unnamed protein product [Closterium sp. NIES-65]|nr:unnamed protein product [Closterium sp. NIES-65]